MKKGETNNPKGRPKGRPNKTTAELRACLGAFVSKEIDELPNLVTLLTPSERVFLLSKFVGYLIPKMQSIDFKSEIDTLISNINNLDEEQTTRLEEIIKNCLNNK